MESSSSSASSSSLSYLMFNTVIMLLSLSLVYPQKAFSYRCHDNERSALLQFKQTFTIDINLHPFGCGDSFFPKVLSWYDQGDHDSNKDCCIWYGIECDEDTGHVIGLDLSCSFLFGSISSNSSLFHLVHLQRLNLASNDFNRSHIPTGLVHLSKLTYLDLSYSSFSGQVPGEISQLSMLSSLNLSDNDLTMNGSNFKSLIHNLTSIKQLILESVKMELTVVPEILANLSSSLTTLNLADCELHGEFPGRVFNLPNLHDLDLSNNFNLSGYLPKFGSSSLQYLFLSNNSFQGLIPVWVFNNTSLEFLDLGHNSITGFDQSAVLFNPHSKLEYLYLDNNRLKGSLPIPPPSISYYDVSNNALEGEIRPLICNLTSLEGLYLADNGFSGKLPPCLVNSGSLDILNLQGNNFSGKIPDIFWANDCQLRVMMLSENQFEGELPRSLANYTWLQVLDVGNNQIKDTFPFWLGTLPYLKVLLLGYNKFSGAIKDPDHQNKTAIFPELHIVDLSHNSFSGHLPCGYFHIWDAMKVFIDNERSQDIYVPITITNKGTAREYQDIQESLNLLDLSSNRFEGEIPDLIGNLQGLHSLNLSNNFLTCRIPSSLGNLSQIEALDLSHNMLSGEIPQQLPQLNFLEIFSVAHNKLTGPIPHGKQFDTFLESSFEGNAGLCGKPLSEECGNSKDSPPSSPTVEEEEEEEEKGSPLAFGWKPVAIGYGCGSVIGIVVGHFVINRRHEWVFYTFGIRLPK